MTAAVSQILEAMRVAIEAPDIPATTKDHDRDDAIDSGQMPINVLSFQGAETMLSDCWGTFRFRAIVNVDHHAAKRNLMPLLDDGVQGISNAVARLMVDPQLGGICENIEFLSFGPTDASGRGVIIMGASFAVTFHTQFGNLDTLVPEPNP